MCAGSAHLFLCLANNSHTDEIYNFMFDRTCAAPCRLTTRRALADIQTILIENALFRLPRDICEHDDAQRAHSGAEMLAFGMVRQRPPDPATVHFLDIGSTRMH